MKVKSLKLLLLLAMIVFFVSGCGISNDSIRNALNNEENCLRACDENADKALKDFENCIAPSRERLNTALNVCRHVPPANREECERKAFETFVKDTEQCFTDYRAKLEEVKKCRKDCRDKFPLELKLE
jgi:hypothetical protein